MLKNSCREFASASQCMLFEPPKWCSNVWSFQPVGNLLVFSKQGNANLKHCSEQGKKHFFINDTVKQVFALFKHKDMLLRNARLSCFFAVRSTREMHQFLWNLIRYISKLEQNFLFRSRLLTEHRLIRIALHFVSRKEIASSEWCRRWNIFTPHLISCVFSFVYTYRSLHIYGEIIHSYQSNFVDEDSNQFRVPRINKSPSWLF